MSKILIAVFAVLAVVATNADLTTEELKEFIERAYVNNTAIHIVNAYNEAIREGDRLANNIEERRVQEFSNSINGILKSIEEARLGLEIVIGGVKLMDDEACSTQSTMQFAEKMPEASTNLIKCFFDKNKADNQLNFLAETKRESLEKVKKLREKLHACIDDNKSNTHDADQCLNDVERATRPVHRTIDIAVKNYMSIGKAMSDAAEKSFNLCNEQYGAPNYSKMLNSIVDKTIECLESAGRERFLRKVPSV